MSSEKYIIFAGEIETVTGAMFRIADPQFDILAIAHGASNTCRFNGQCKFYYPVACHAVMVSRILAAEGCYIDEQMEGLLHDGNESYLPDVPSPYKSLLPDLRGLEDWVDGKLRAWHNLPPQKSEEVKYADLLALQIEAWFLLPSRGLSTAWDRLSFFREPAQAYIRRGFRVPQYDVPPSKAKSMFLQRYQELTNQHEA